MRNFYLFTILLMGIGFQSCVGDDFVDDEIEPTIRILNPVEKIQLGSTHQFEFSYFNNVGLQENIDDAFWSSSNENIIAIDQNGIARALQEGIVNIIIERSTDSGTISDQLEVEATESPIEEEEINKNGVIRTTSSYTLTGDFTISEVDNNLEIRIEDNYRASTALPGLYVYLTNNPNTIANALEIGEVEVFSGAHSYIVQDVNINEYQYLLYFCKPFNVKVGDGQFN